MRRRHIRWSLLAVGAVGAISAAGLAWTGKRAAAAEEDGAMVTVTVPEQLDPLAETGTRIFAAVCAECHGANAAGRAGKGPPLVHRIYEPGHHADESFQRAVAHGVRAHHWPFGDMSPVPGLTRADVAAVAAWLRTVQRANGIE